MNMLKGFNECIVRQLGEKPSRIGPIFSKYFLKIMKIENDFTKNCYNNFTFLKIFLRKIWVVLWHGTSS